MLFKALSCILAVIVIAEILVVDDSAAVRGAIRRFIEISTPYKVCGEAGDRVAAIDKASEFSCDLILLDLSMPMLNGVETASTLRRMAPGTKIIGLAMFAGEVRRSLLPPAVSIWSSPSTTASRSWRRRSRRCCPPPTPLILRGYRLTLCPKEPAATAAARKANLTEWFLTRTRR